MRVCVRILFLLSQAVCIDVADGQGGQVHAHIAVNKRKEQSWTVLAEHLVGRPKRKKR